MNATDSVIFWFRRDLRLDDNTALYQAMASGSKVQAVFIFDSDILGKLPDKDDARVTFIFDNLRLIDEQLRQVGASLSVYHGSVLEVWADILTAFGPVGVYYNHDYEPEAIRRDEAVNAFLRHSRVNVSSYQDQVIFEKSAIIKNDGTPYTVYTPYKRRWLEQLTEQAIHTHGITLREGAFLAADSPFPSLDELGFSRTKQPVPTAHYEAVIRGYGNTRDIPALENGTTLLGIHLRFGTVSIRKLVQAAVKMEADVWLSELIWREFFMMILWHFPHTVNQAFRPAYDHIEWRNDEAEFQAWCDGQTGYPIVDAGMRQLKETGFMHNRVRMITASFLCKHLLIDWRWGEAYFARKLLDYELSSNIGNWQWVAGCGTDAAPYFRVFSPELQTKRFDPKHEYIKRWVLEYADPFTYVNPIVDHKQARERALAVYKRAVGA